MNRRHFSTLLALALATGLGGISCAQTPTPPTADAPPGAAAPGAAVALTVSVAASVQDAMKAVQTAYQAEAPNVAITYNFGSSGSLAQQISQGAPTDVFLSASKKWMDDLEHQGEILAGSRQDLLLNSLVLIVPRDNPAKVTGFGDLGTAQLGKLAMGEPDSVPAGQYAKETLVSLQLFEALQPKLVFGKDVRQVLAYVETGEVDAGLVYATDAKVANQVQVVATAAADTHAPIIYPVAVVADSRQSAAAEAFVTFLGTDQAAAIFQSYGFTMAE